MAGIVTVKALRKEMKALEEAGELFSAYQVGRVQEKISPAGVGREKQSEGQKVEDYERILGDIQFGQMYEQVSTRAPLLCGLLNGLMAPKTERKDRPPRDPVKFNHRIAIITSILCYSRTSEGSNKFPRMFGAFLHHAPDIHTIGLERVATQKLELFNAKVVRDEDRIVVPLSERRGATTDLDPNSDIMAILPLEDRDETREWGLPSDVLNVGGFTLNFRIKVQD